MRLHFTLMLTALALCLAEQAGPELNRIIPRCGRPRASQDISNIHNTTSLSLQETRSFFIPEHPDLRIDVDFCEPATLLTPASVEAAHDNLATLLRFHLGNDLERIFGRAGRGSDEHDDDVVLRIGPDPEALEAGDLISVDVAQDVVYALWEDFIVVDTNARSRVLDYWIWKERVGDVAFGSLRKSDGSSGGVGVA